VGIGYLYLDNLIHIRDKVWIWVSIVLVLIVFIYMAKDKVLISSDYIRFNPLFQRN
jgi:hypothetical protein